MTNTRKNDMENSRKERIKKSESAKIERIKSKDSREKRKRKMGDEDHDLDPDVLNVSPRKVNRQDRRRDLSCLLHVASLLQYQGKNRATSLFCLLFYPKINTDIGPLHFLRGMRHVCHVIAVTRVDTQLYLVVKVELDLCY